jgi:two-component system, OmpR family, KDP operon response regulator KdpE
VKILVIDDDPSLLRALRVGLKAGSHDVTTAVNAEAGLSQAALSSPDVIVLDMGLPDLDGLVVCQRIRQWSEVPIIVLSAAGDEDRKIAALNAGANDYVTKPFSMAELEARLRAVSRYRAAESDDPSPATLTLGTLEIDLVHHEARQNDVALELTSKEFDVLSFLARHAGKTCTYQMILAAVWGTGYQDESRYVHAYVHRLRQKLNDEQGRLIQTAPGIGYSLHPDGPSGSVPGALAY